MQLTESQIRGLIEKPKNQDRLIEVLRHERRLCMHVDGVGIDAILNKVRPILTDSKLTNFKHLLEAWSKPLFDEMNDLKNKLNLSKYFKSQTVKINNFITIFYIFFCKI